MSTLHVCSTCCRRLARRVSPAPVTKHIAYASSSAIDSLLSDDSLFPRSRQNRQPRYSRPGRRQPQNGLQDRPAVSRDTGNRPPSEAEDFTTLLASTAIGSTGRYSRPHSRSIPPATAVTADAEDVSDPGRPCPAAARAFTSELEELLAARRLNEAWDFFREHFSSQDSPAIARPSIRDYAKVSSGVVYRKLLSALNTAWLREVRAGRHPADVPTPLELLDRFERVGIASTTMYPRAMWTLVSELSVMMAASSVEPPYDCVKTLVGQIMPMWEHCLAQQQHVSTDQDVGAIPQSTSPASPLSFADSQLLAQTPRKGLSKDFQTYFTVFVPAAQSKGQSDSLTASALLTYDSLTQAISADDILRCEFEQYSPFTDSVDTLLRRFRLGDRLVTEIERRLVKHTMTAEAARSLCARLQAHHQPNAYESPISARPATETSVASMLQRYVKALGTANEKQDLDSAERLWENASALLKIQDAQSPDADSVINVYEQFLLTFFALRRPQTALEIWNLMVQMGNNPTVRTWTVMMKGCHISRDVHIMESLWHRMRDSGIQPDVAAWSTRIYGLLRVGKIQDGLRALDEMGEEWTLADRQSRAKTRAPQQAKAGPPDPAQDFNVPRPNTAILNSALTSLGNRGAENFPNILAWGRSFGIEPDVITYNTLLSVSLGQGDGEEAVKILQSMASAGVEPDSSTFTILLNNMLRSSFLAGLSHAEQEEHVMEFVSSVESNGVRIDGKGYALLIDRLLKEYVNLPAAHRVLAHMATRNVQPTPHIYTILMTHYFDMSPPDLKSADVLWNQLQSRNNSYGAALDTIFYDRMIEGYARHGDAGRTMAFLTRMSKEGKRPGWLAMTAVVRCLASKEDWDRLTQVVLDCHRQEGLLSAGLRGRKGQAEFWQLVRDLGVLDRLGLDVD
ncbi:hypothetical protein MBLNU459_g3723t1 [Dothideomycetes sp. NU459]